MHIFFKKSTYMFFKENINPGIFPRISRKNSFPFISALRMLLLVRNFSNFSGFRVFSCLCYAHPSLRVLVFAESRLAIEYHLAIENVHACLGLVQRFAVKADALDSQFYLFCYRKFFLQLVSKFFSHFQKKCFGPPKNL